MSVHTYAGLSSYFALMNDLPRSLYKLLLGLACLAYVHSSGQALVRGKRYRHAISHYESCHDSLMLANKNEEKLQATIDSLRMLNADLFSKLNQLENFIEEYGSVDLSANRWMIKSLRDTLYQDGSRMKQAKNAREWNAYYLSGEPCYVRPKSEPNSEYGFLYNIHAVNSFHRWAPDFLAIPNTTHTAALFDYLAEAYSDTETKDRGALLKSVEGWPMTPGINLTSLSVHKGGFISGESFFMDVKTNFWLLPEMGTEKVEALSFSDYNNQVGIFSRNRNDNYGFYIRCIINPNKNGK
jgi:uncharacterized protein (TIGR02145 family)